jgi:quercetin 2,3-dioxygenase
VRIHQDAAIYASIIGDGDQVEHLLAPGRLGYVHVARGGLTVNGMTLDAGDALKLTEEERVVLAGTGEAEILLFDLPR